MKKSKSILKYIYSDKKKTFLELKEIKFHAVLLSMPLSLHNLSTKWDKDPSLNSFYVKHMTRTYFQLPRKWGTIVCSERPLSENRITQEPFHKFASQVNLLVLIWYESPPEVIYEHTLAWK